MEAQARRERIYTVLQQVPPGKVVTYGQVAELAGLGAGARQVGAALKGLPKDSQIPWHRVINAQGKISLPEGAPYQRQADLLAKEGVTLLNGRVNLRSYQWNP